MISCFRALVLASIAISCVVPMDSLAAASGAVPSNILVILTDDQGVMEYSASGAKDLRTPNMDRLFREGATFRNFRANSCVCSPTRAALLTGRNSDRAGVPGVIRSDPAGSWGWLSPTEIGRASCRERGTGA